MKTTIKSIIFTILGIVIMSGLSSCANDSTKFETTPELVQERIASYPNKDISDILAKERVQKARENPEVYRVVKINEKIFDHTYYHEVQLKDTAGNIIWGYYCFNTFEEDNNFCLVKGEKYHIFTQNDVKGATCIIGVASPY